MKVPDPPLRTEVSYLFGVIGDRGIYQTDLWSRGVRAITLEFKWRLYEPQEGIYDQDYINAMKQKLIQLKNQGWYVQVIPGFHYTPSWVFEKYPDMYYVNQYGENYSPDPIEQGDFRVINAPFNPQARALIAGYLRRIFQDFNQNDPSQRFDSVRIGGSVQGELRYPPAEPAAPANSYWAFDRHAQNPAESGIPASVIGWKPGIDANPGTTGRGQLIVNPGFESTQKHFGVIGWSPDDEVIAETVSNSPHSGNAAMKLTISTANRVHQFVRVTPGTLYHLSGWLRSEDGVGQARIFITQYNDSWQYLSNSAFLKLETRSKSWTSLEGSLALSSSTSVIKVELDGDRAGTYYFDDLMLYRDGENDIRSRNIDVPLAFYNWYVQALNDYQNWQISEVRKYFSGQLDLVYAGKGIRTTQITDALTNDLSGNGWSESLRALYAGVDYKRLVGGLASYERVTLYLTGVEVPPADQVDDTSRYPGDWSAAHWLAYLATMHGIRIWGENTGRNTNQELQLSIDRMKANHFLGFIWATESQLYANPNSNDYANADELEQIIQQSQSRTFLYLPITRTSP